MKLSSVRKLPGKIQYLLSVLLVLSVAVICFWFKALIGYKMVALILLMTVSVTAMLFDMRPVLLAAFLSAVTWNFFFIPPLYTFHIDNAEDVLMFLLYFAIVLINAVLTFNIRQAENKARDKEEKEKELKLYNTLLNSLSHELRTPISAILGSVDTLKENNHSLSEKNKIDLLDEIEIAAYRLNRQVENILNMSRLESGMLKTKQDWTDVNELLNEVIEKVAADEQHPIIFHGNDHLPFFKIDRGLTEQIVHNLIHNAVIYTAPKTTITIEAKHETENCIITIADNGAGFPEKEMEMVFEKFYRLPHSKAGGSGLGLSIVKGFTEAQNGTIHLANNQQGGATFTIILPAEANYLNNLKNE